MKKSPSQFSATMIGVHDEKHNPAREMFLQEAREVQQIMNGVHHARKISHLQVNYPDTITKLSSIQAEKTLSASNSSALLSTYTTKPPSDKERVQEFKQTKLKDYQDAMKDHIVHERFINFRKKEYNREMGRKAVANQVISGKAPMPEKQVLFPHGATHEQILAITGTLKASDPDKIPPEVPRQKKWKGDGW